MRCEPVVIKLARTSSTLGEPLDIAAHLHICAFEQGDRPGQFWCCGRDETDGGGRAVVTFVLTSCGAKRTSNLDLLRPETYLKIYFEVSMAPSPDFGRNQRNQRKSISISRPDLEPLKMTFQALNFEVHFGPHERKRRG